MSNNKFDILVCLVNGPSKYEGRVEVKYNGEWGTVCDDGWTLSAAQVVCRELGFGPAVFARIGSYYGQGYGPIWLDDVICVGNESSIKKCQHSGWGVHDCDHSEDAGVKCSPEGILILQDDNVIIRLNRTISFTMDSYRGPLLLSMHQAWKDDKNL